jgi:hypothetical protein
LVREFIRRTPEIGLFSSRTKGRFGPQTTNSLYFTLLPGNCETETGSLETASSSRESDANLTSAILAWLVVLLLSGLGQDVIELADVLKLPKFAVVGHCAALSVGWG